MQLEILLFQIEFEMPGIPRQFLYNSLYNIDDIIKLHIAKMAKNLNVFFVLESILDQQL